MKKFLFILFATIICAQMYAHEFSNGLYLSGEASFNTSYIWRGQTLAMPCVEPTVAFGYANTIGDFSHDVNIAFWGAYGEEFNAPMSFYGESDVNLSYEMTYKYFTIGASLGYYYYTIGKPGNIAKSSNLNFGGYVVPYNVYSFTVYFETILLGDDGDPTVAHPIDGKSGVYSTYVEFSYPIDLGNDITLTPRLGFTPKYSIYTDYLEPSYRNTEYTGAINNVAIDCEKIWNFDNYSCRLFGTLAVNPYRATHIDSNPLFGYVMHTNIGIAISF